MQSARPDDDALYAYVEAQIQDGDGAARFPAVHQYVLTVGQQDEHYLALVALLQQAQVAQLEPPPRPATFDFSYLQQPRVTRAVNVFVEMGRLVINLSRDFVEQAMAESTLQLAHIKASAADTLFETVVADQQSGFKTRLVVKRNRADRTTCSLSVKLEPPHRRWPDLAGIPVEISMGTIQQAQVTNAFGTTLFAPLPIVALDTLTIRVGPTPELTT
jgi:hypothetical protein